MRMMAAASLLSLAMVPGVAGPGLAALHFDCDHVTVHISATVDVPPCNRHDELNLSPAGCQQHAISIGRDCDPEWPRGSAAVDCEFSGNDFTGTLNLNQYGPGVVSGMSTTIVPFFVDLSGEYEISFQQTASGNCGGAGVQINGPAGPVGGGFWPGEDPSPRVFRAILLTGWSYEIVFHQEGQTSPECSQRYDQVGGFGFEYVGNPERACCDLATGGCSVMTADPCRALGREWHPEWPSCVPNLCPQPVPGAVLKLGGWVNPEPWHHWVAATPGSVIPIQFDSGDLAVPIDSVRFYYSTNHGASWQHFATDHNGAEPWLNTTDTEVHAEGDGWYAELPVPGPLPDPAIQFKVQAFTEEGAYESRGEQNADWAPPSLCGVSTHNWDVTERDTLGTEVISEGTDVDRIIAFRSLVGDTYTKGIPGIDEHVISAVHCVPAAAAQCLKYFEAHGDYEVTGGLDDSTLVFALGQSMQTHPVKGTLMTKWTSGLAKWIQTHGDGYTVRAYRYFESLGGHTWTLDDWLMIQAELERSQDVMVGVFWDTGGGHALTLNSITNPALPDGRILIGFKDPWNGQSSTGNLDPTTGEIFNMTGAGSGHVGYMGFVLIACPREEAVNLGGPGLAVFDGLPPGPPYLVPIPLEDPGLYFIHIVVVNTANHAHRISRIVVKSTPGAVPERSTVRPLTCHLSPPVPNPFRTVTQIAYTVPARMPVNLTVFDVAGRKVRVLYDGQVLAGSFRATWDGRDDEGRAVASGIYYVKMRTPTQEATQALALLK